MTDDELRQLFESLRQDNATLRQGFGGFRQDNAALREDFAALRQDNVTIRQEISAAHNETRRYFGEFVERLDSKFDLLIEAVALLDGKVDRKTGDLERRMDRGFADTQAMIKFSHAELDRRMRTLEEGFADLQARVERLESSTH